MADETNAGGLTEADALAGVLGDIRVAFARRADWWIDDTEHSLLVNVLRGECVPWAEGLLASDWLAEREAARDAAWAATIEAVLAPLDAWTGDYPHPDSSSPHERDRLRALLTADHAKALDAVKVKAAQEALREYRDALAANESADSWSGRADFLHDLDDWTGSLRADRLTTDTP